MPQSFFNIENISWNLDMIVTILEMECCKIRHYGAKLKLACFSLHLSDEIPGVLKILHWMNWFMGGMGVVLN